LQRISGAGRCVRPISRLSPDPINTCRHSSRRNVFSSE